MLLPETLKLHDQQSFEFHYIYFLPWKDQMVEAIRTQGGKVSCFSARTNIGLMLKLWAVCRYVRENDIQLIHAHLPWAGVLARLVGKATGVPVVYTEHNKQERYHFLTRFMNLRTMGLASALVAVSRDVEESIRKHKPGLSVPLSVVLNGVNITHFRRDVDGQPVRDMFRIPAGVPVVGTVAVFRFQKRLDVWLEAAKHIRGQLPEARFILVGDGPLKAELEQAVARLGVGEYVHFAGLQTEIRPYLAAFDIFMISSIFEGLPVAMLEAMAFGCPVVTTDAGGIKEVISSGKDGLMCSIDKPMELVPLAVDVLTHPDKAKQLQEQGRRRIEESFSMDKMVRELETLYRRMARAEARANR
jgi:glycosyltransferase involved in cell wall biosynthesis